MNEDRQSWERQPGESARAYEAFCRYRDAGSARSLRKLAQQGYKSVSLLRRWNDRHAWQERVAQYDAYRERKAREEREVEHLKDLEEYRKQEKQLSSVMIQSAIAMLGKANTRLQKVDPDDIPVAALPSMFRAIAAVAESASNTKAQALAVEELLEAVRVGDHRGS